MNAITNIDKKLFGGIINCSVKDMQLIEVAIALHKTHRNKNLKIKGTFLEAIYLDDSKYIDIMKSTQCGISEYLVCFAINDAKNGRNVFYVLPTYVLKNQFVKERFDKTITYTKYYRSLISASKNLWAESTSLKMLNHGSIAFVGSNTANAFLSYPADTMVVDEQTNCNQENLSMGIERLSASEDPREIRVGNPTITNFGIHSEFKCSDQKAWVIKNHCGHYIKPDFFKHVVRMVDENIYIIIDKNYDQNSGKDIQMICDRCGKPIDRFGIGEWVKTIEHEHSGYHISKLFSTNATLKQLVDRLGKGLVNDTEMQRLYNGDLGLPYVAKGAKIDEEILNNCIEDYILPKKPKFGTIMGVDIGAVINVVIREIMPDGRKFLVYADQIKGKELSDIDKLVELCKKYNVKCAVVDGLPETRFSKKFANSFPGAFMCFFGNEKKDRISLDDKMVTVHRTQMLDSVKENFMTETFVLPKNIRNIEDYYSQITASTRIYDTKKDIYTWEEGNKEDHYFLAEGYCVIANRILNMAAG